MPVRGWFDSSEFFTSPATMFALADQGVMERSCHPAPN